jgi:hypothetical protein
MLVHHLSVWDINELLNLFGDTDWVVFLCETCPHLKEVSC